MTQDFDRIRILWIDDLPNRQTSDLGELANFFEIVGRTDKPCWIRSIDDYKELRTEYKRLKEFNVDTLNSLPYFPVEIISADYDLSKFSGNDSIGSINIESIKSLGGASLFPQSFYAEESSELVLNNPDREDVNHDDFQGCLINLFYLIEFSSHPCGSVVTTYQEPIRQKLAAKQIESFLEEMYGIDPLYPAKRCWNLIIKAGVKALRKRIDQLYEDNKVVLSVSDLIAMVNGSTNGVLTLQSEFAVRRLPVAGLFIDHEDDGEKLNEIREWASELLNLKVSQEHYQFAKDISEKIWERYNDDELVEAHKEFSRLHISLKAEQGKSGNAGEENQKKYDEYYKLFGLKKIGNSDNSYKCTSKICLDIGSVDLPGGEKRQRDMTEAEKKTTEEKQKNIIRWAVIFLMLKLMKRYLICTQKVRNTVSFRLREEFHSEKKESFIHKTLSPELDDDDLYLLLFPVPKTPFPLPWHMAERKDTWQQVLRRKEINLQEFLYGKALTAGERCLVQGILMKDVEFTELGEDEYSRLEAWKSWETSRRFVFGS